MARNNEFDSSNISVFAGNANPVLAQDITRHLKVPLGRAHVGRFSDGEVNAELMENVRGRDVFIVQPTCPPANDNLMELLMMTDACRRASARRITAVMPYFGYARQDRRPRATRVAIAAKLVANMVVRAGVDRLLTVDLHADQIQGFFDIPVDNVYASPVLLGDAWKHKDGGMVVVSPDVGGVVRARALAKRLDDAELAIIDKRRPRPNESKVMNIIGRVEGKNCMLVDDMVDTAGTLCQAAQALKDAAKRQEGDDQGNAKSIAVIHRAWSRGSRRVCGRIAGCRGKPDVAKAVAPTAACRQHSNSGADCAPGAPRRPRGKAFNAVWSGCAPAAPRTHPRR